MRGNHQFPTIVLEAVASQDLWFSHGHCGQPGSCNDISVLQTSPLFLAQRNGIAPKCPFQVNGYAYKCEYFLTDGIYHTWSMFVKKLSYPTDPNEKKFKKLKEGARKNVECFLVKPVS
ncbi:putative harbinger transposase-derived protein [Helianthus annuus]|nr:putative harbinger transposase-derived protein [Helianthus annuus]KAJ0631919.1 putative harbinger transposase-derived protein [Helianthus annuus]KAJ0825700.1 putative harbinger transposase-derived protein [Helianthus annuus]